MKIQLTQKTPPPRCSVVDTPCFQTAEGLGLVPGWETEIPADHVVPGWGGGVVQPGDLQGQQWGGRDCHDSLKGTGAWGRKQEKVFWELLIGNTEGTSFMCRI